MTRSTPPRTPAAVPVVRYGVACPGAVRARLAGKEDRGRVRVALICSPPREPLRIRRCW